jgi:CheY-like chemotaxis protein
MDLMMPQISGLEVMRRIHLIEPRTQVIIVTGFASKETAIEALNLHAFGLLEKPVLLQQLYRLVADAFARYQERSNDGAALEAEISTMYDEVATLARALERSPDDPQLRDAYDQRLRQLRDAQVTEADLASRAFREKLALKKGSGYSSIEAARRELDRDKDFT